MACGLPQHLAKIPYMPDVDLSVGQCGLLFTATPDMVSKTPKTIQMQGA